MEETTAAALQGGQRVFLHSGPQLGICTLNIFVIINNEETLSQSMGIGEKRAAVVKFKLPPIAGWGQILNFYPKLVVNFKFLLEHKILNLISA